MRVVIYAIGKSGIVIELLEHLMSIVTFTACLDFYIWSKLKWDYTHFSILKFKFYLCIYQHSAKTQPYNKM